MNEDFKRIVEALRTALATADAKGTITFANEAFARLVGRDRTALVDASLSTFFIEADRKRIQQNITRVGDGKAAVSLVDARVSFKDRWVQVAVQPALGARDKAEGVVVLLRDIGPERESEEALNLSAARLLAMTEGSPVPTMVENNAGEVEIANEALCRLLGLKSAPQSLAGVPVADVFAKATARNAVAQLQREPILVDDQETGAVWRVKDTSAVQHVGTKDAAEIALIEKIGMELSIAMEGISAITIRAQQLDFDPELVDHFLRIRTSTETAVAAIGDIVDFSKVSGGVVLHKTQFGLRAALANLVARLATNAEEHECRLRIKVEQDVTDWLEGDVQRLLLVVKNLLDNTFAMLPGHEVMLQVMPEYETETGIQLSFCVIPEGDATQLVSADAGMGVALAKFMVSAMGGKLAVATRLGAGALYAFTLEFPVMEAPPAPRRATYVSLVGLPVMVVSADPDQRLQITNLLRGWRLVPLEADNAAMAMALLERMHSESTPIALVILSNELPGQDGFLLAFRIKNHDKFFNTLVMMLASEGRPGDAIACRENGIAAYMRYPIGDRQLNEAIVAVTGASIDVDETPTLVTRHSLREKRKGATILLIDPNRESQILASHILGRQDCSVVAAQDLDEAMAALDQDMYDIVIVDTSLKGLGGDDAARMLRARIPRDADKAFFVAVSLDHSPRYREAKLQLGFNATIQKPFRKDDLMGLLESVGAAPVEAG
ncbi:MAG TPA: response regulator [Usitatibacter sp.]